MILCIDCAHFTQTGSDSPICLNAPKPDPVFGRKDFYHCSVERAGHTRGDCGKDAQHFVTRLEAA